jgi:WD40 repeat protein
MAQPTYIFRGHTAQIHALHFWRRNTRLLSADADGWMVIWDIQQSLRPVVCWKPHEGCVLGIETWDDDKIITYVRSPATAWCSRVSMYLMNFVDMVEMKP